MAGENDLELRIVANTAQAEENFRGLERRLAGLGVEIEKVAAESKAAGGADAELQAKLDRLNAEYDEGVKKLGAYRAAQDDVKKATAAASASIDGQVRPINSAGDAFDRMGGKIGKAGGILTAVVATFTTFYEATSRLRDKVNEFTDGALDRLIQKAIALNPLYKALGKLLGEDLSGATEEAIKSTDKLGTSLEAQAKFANQAADSTKGVADAATVAFEENKKLFESTTGVAEGTEAIAAGAKKVAEVAPKAFRETGDEALKAAEKTAKLREETEALAQAQKALENAQKSQGDAQQSLSELQARAAELKDKGFLSADEAQEQLDISKRLFDAEQQLTKASQDTTLAQLDADAALRKKNEAEDKAISLAETREEGLTRQKELVEELTKASEVGAVAMRKLHEEIAVIKTDLTELKDLAGQLAAVLAGLGE